MTTQDRIFRMARAELGDRDINPNVLSEVYSETVNYCLEQGYWNFAMVTASLATQGGVTQFGYTYPYQKPSGYVRTFRLGMDETLWPPLEDYADAKDQIHANVSPLYLAYISSATDSGYNLSNWPDSFAVYVAGELARRVCKRTGGSREEYNELEARVTKIYLPDARSKDAMNEGVAWPPEGRWVRARRSSVGRERGNRGSLIG